MIVKCPHCSVRVILSPSGTCPSCRKNVDKAELDRAAEVESKKKADALGTPETPSHDVIAPGTSNTAADKESNRPKKRKYLGLTAVQWMFVAPLPVVFLVACVVAFFTVCMPGFIKLRDMNREMQAVNQPRPR